MTAKLPQLLTLSLLALLLISPLSAQRNAASNANQGGDWLEWRGPARDGTSPEKGLPEKWSPQGENLVWKAPYGGRSAPIVMGNRVFLFNSSGKDETLQERLMCLDADTGRVLWEHKFTVYSSDVPPRRVAWSSPAGDAETGNVYVFGANNQLAALSQDGKLVWERSFTDEFGAWTTHGGRTVSPIIEGDLVIVSTVTDGILDLSQRRHRYYALDKRTGDVVWISTPGQRPFDTTYSTPAVATVNGTKILIAGGGDGAVHAMKVNTGEPVWSFPVSKRGVNPGVVVKSDARGTTAFISHQEENLDTAEMGFLAAVDATAKGAIQKDHIKWSIRNYQLGPSTPVIDGDRYYQVDAGANLFAFDTNTGRKLWEQNLGTIQKASPILADGKLYVGTENGKFFILRPSATGCQILDGDELDPVEKVQTVTEAGDDLIASNEQIIASVAVSRGRIYLVSTKAIYAIGRKGKTPAFKPAANQQAPAASQAAPAHVQIIPADVMVRPGEAAKFRVRLFDASGNFIREEQSAAWSLEGLKGTAEGNQFTAASDAGAQAGKVKATVGGVSGAAYVRVIPPLPLVENFESIAVGGVPKYWINAANDPLPPRYAVREVDGGKVLVKNPNPAALKRTRTLIGPTTWADYTVEADVRAVEKRRQMGDAGVVAQRYTLVLFGNGQKLELQSWQIEPKRTVTKPFAWKADTWYKLKLRVENLPDGRVRALGKAWPATEPEPQAWTIERVDAATYGNRQGSPGIYADAPNDVLFDNIKVTSNK
jgi:outer membrane protein assembly factor BamB